MILYHIILYRVCHIRLCYIAFCMWGAVNGRFRSTTGRQVAAEWRRREKERERRERPCIHTSYASTYARMMNSNHL